MKSIWGKAILAVLCMQVLGGLGAFFTTSQISTWYATLNEPPGTPPNWLFGPVWAILYSLIGIAFALIWHYAPAGPAKRTALTIFVIQLVLNLAWSPVFFAMHQMGFALIIIACLWGAIVLNIIHFRRLHALSGLLLLPYLAWVSYASYLNAGYWWLNR